MIGYLQGEVIVRDDPYVFINVSGVGYRVLASLPVLTSVLVGEQLTVFTYTHVREDVLELFGFPSLPDLKLFELLISVSGVGPRTALSVFSVGDKNAIIQAITDGDVAFFTSVPRLGTKNAQKLIIELKTKVGGQGIASLSDLSESKDSEVGLALKAFGFSSREVQDVLQSLRKDGKQTLSVEEQVKHALKYLGK